MSVFEDSEETQRSQDLFAEYNNPRREEQNCSNQEIMDFLKKIDKRLDGMEADIAKIKKEKETKKSFKLDECSFKKRLNIYLKNKFSTNPWLSFQTDIDFKNEVKKYLKKDGFGDDQAAYKVVTSYAASKFTDLRNQLRRKIIQEVKEDGLAKVKIDEMANILFNNYVPSSESVDSEDRIKLCLLLRAFLYNNKILRKYAQEDFLDFWGQFKSYFDTVMTSDKEDKWEKIHGTDNRRLLKLTEKEA